MLFSGTLFMFDIMILKKILKQTGCSFDKKYCSKRIRVRIRRD